MKSRFAPGIVCLLAAVACSDPPSESVTFRTDLARWVRLAADRPDSVRDAFAQALRAAASAEAAQGAALDTARRLARAYEVAWGDAFLIRQVDRFEAASPAGRQTAAEADSLWRAGRTAMGQEGVPTAMLLWRMSLRLAEVARDSASQARALYSIGAGFGGIGMLDSATAYLDRAYATARAAGDQRSVGNTLGIMANVSRDRGDLSHAAELYEQALAIRPLSGDARGMAADHNNLGLVARALGDLVRAREAFERALALNRAGGNQRAAAVNLGNLGDVASERGEYEDARSLYEQALTINRAAGDVAEQGFVLHDLGVLSSRRGDYAHAIAQLSEAIEIHDKSGAVQDAISARADLAAVQGAVGELEGAMATLRQAASDALAVDTQPSILARVSLAHADLAVQFGSYPESDVEYARAEQLFGQAGDAAGRAEAQHGRALLLLLRDDHDGALRQIELAARTLESGADPRAAALTRLLAGDVHRTLGDTLSARLVLTTALHTLRGLGDAGGEAAALSALGDLAQQRGAPIGAESFYRSGLERLDRRRIPDVRWRLHAGLAAAMRSRGALATAAGELRAAIAAIEDVASGVRADERRAGFLTDKWEVYGSLAAVEQQRGRPVDAFMVSERMRARQMLGILERGRVLPNRTYSAREQDLRRRISELGRVIEAAEEHPATQREVALAEQSTGAAREALDAAQREYANLLIGMRDSLPEYARLVSATATDWRTIAGRLGPDEALLQYLLTDSTSLVFFVDRDTVVAFDLNVDRRTIGNLVDFARHAMDRPAGHEETQLWPGALRRLHHFLIGPVERAGLLAPMTKLIIVPHSELHFLPFGALLNGPGEGELLIERFQLAYAASASVWLHMSEAPRTRSRRVLALAPTPTRLPASLDEVAAIRVIRGRRNSRILVGNAATESAFRAAASRYGTLHLATVGVLNKHNPLFSWMELAPDGEHDGRLEVHEVYDLELVGQTIVLSACQTAVGAGNRADIPPGDDWVGLVQAFVQAGAGSVIASLWPVDDRASATLMERFYGALDAGRSEAAALAEAQRAMARDPDTAHPFYWAAFIVTGSNGKE